ncbi:MAG: glutathione metabolism protein [Burkholderiales bacterium PBB5]|nr:MAG: glutathione metabolism protein [Burkholderiales bacterium PBB5]
MTMAKWCVLAACLLPIATVGLAKVASARQPRGRGAYDNRDPRAWARQLTGWAQRAHAAQLNGFESLPLFVAAVLFAQMAADAAQHQGRIDQLALAYVGLRVVYSALYILDQATLRTLVWTASMAVCVALLALGF